MKLAEFCQNWNKVTSRPSPQCLVDQIQVQKPILAFATDQMPDYIYATYVIYADWLDFITFILIW